MNIFEKFFGAKYFHLLAILILAVAILITYSNTFNASFHFDDNPNIVENPYIKSITWENIKKLLHHTRPVTNLTLLLNYQINGLNVIGWHIFNTLMHIFNSIFVYFLFFITLNLPSFENKFNDASKSMALFGALLFAVHPIQTESVTYIISRTELLAAFFYLGTLLLYIKYRIKPKISYLILATISAYLAMGSKEHAVTLPAILFLYDYIFLANRNLKETIKYWKELLLIASSWILLTILLLSSKLEGAGFNITKETDITPLTYLFTQFNVIWTYIRLLFLPINQNLDYDYPIAKTLFEFPTFLSFVGHIAVILLTLYLFLKKGWKLIPFGIAWFYITLSPTSSIVPILDVIFEHRLYLPSVGFFLTFITFYEGLFRWIDIKKKRLVNQNGLSL